MPERTDLISDCAYLCNVLLGKLQRLERIEGDGQRRSHWQQAAGAVRKIRGYLRRRLDDERQREKRETLAQEGRWPGHG